MGLIVGEVEGEVLGADVGDAEGDVLGADVGEVLGVAVGEVGEVEGAALGDTVVGAEEGLLVGGVAAWHTHTMQASLASVVRWMVFTTFGFAYNMPSFRSCAGQSYRVYEPDNRTVQYNTPY